MTSLTRLSLRSPIAGMTRLSLRSPLATGLLLAAATLLAAAGLPRLATDVGYRAFLGESHPALVELDAFLERFDSGLPMAAVWSCKETTRCQSVFDAESLLMAHDLATRLAEAPGVRRVESPATAALAIPTPFGPSLRRLTEQGEVVPEHAALGRRARIDPTWVGQLISADGRVGAVVVELDSSDGAVAEASYAALDQALAPHEARGFRFHRVGGPVEFVVAGGELEAATARLIPVMVLLVGVCLLALFRSLWVSAAVLACVGVAVVWTMGLLGWLSSWGWAQNSLTQTLPPLVLVIGVCDGIHLVARFQNDAAAGAPRDPGDRARRLGQIAAEVGPPCLVTSVTTAAGFLSFATAELESFVRFGAMAAFGVMSALFLSFSLLPLLLSRIPPTRPRAERATRTWQTGLERVLRAAERAPLAVLAVALLAGAGGAWGMTQLRVDASFEELYGEESRVVRWAHFVGEHLRRPDTLEIALDLPASARPEDPPGLGVLAEVSAALEEIPSLGKARSLLVPLAWTHRLVRGDDPDFERFSDDAQENAALIALWSSLNESGQNHWIGAGGPSLRISVDSEKSQYETLERVFVRVDEILASLPPGLRGSATGPLAVVHQMIGDIRDTQLRSFGSAALAIGVMLSLFLGSLRWGLLALIPTGLPVVWTLGALGVSGIALDVGSAMVAAVVLGIAVDDAVHLLAAYRRRRRAGEASRKAVRGAVLQVGRALVTTSLALALGFSALALSPWQSVSSFGLVSAIAILGALLAALLVLPAAVIAFAGRDRA